MGGGEKVEIKRAAAYFPFLAYFPNYVGALLWKFERF
jgi:hypothetical protein